MEDRPRGRQRREAEHELRQSSLQLPSSSRTQEESNKYESEVGLPGCYENIFVKVEG